jgi:hypothetical protein
MCTSKNINFLSSCHHKILKILLLNDKVPLASLQSQIIVKIYSAMDSMHFRLQFPDNSALAGQDKTINFLTDLPAHLQVQPSSNNRLKL